MNTTVEKSALLSADQAGALLGISGQLARDWIRMGLLRAEKVGKAYVIRSEDLAAASERYYRGYFTNAPSPRVGSINLVRLNQ